VDNVVQCQIFTALWLIYLIFVQKHEKLLFKVLFRCNLAKIRQFAPIGDNVKEPNSAATEIAATVQSRRKSLGVTQSQLADLAGVSPKFVYDLEKGKPSVSLDRVLLVITALGLEFKLELATNE
jgi:y4mF family transcriptional regulator